MQLLRGSNSRITQLIFHFNNQEIQVHEILIQQILMIDQEMSQEKFQTQGERQTVQIIMELMQGEQLVQVICKYGQRI